MNLKSRNLKDLPKNLCKECWKNYAHIFVIKGFKLCRAHLLNRFYTLKESDNLSNKELNELFKIRTALILEDGFVKSINISLKQYNMTKEDYNNLLAKQQGRCAGCGLIALEGQRRLSVDHCHSTLEIRGLLCNSCNSLLGCAKDQAQTLKNLARYLQGEYTGIFAAKNRKELAKMNTTFMIMEKYITNN